MRLAFVRAAIALLVMLSGWLPAAADPTQTGRLPAGMTVPAPLPLGISVIGGAPSNDRKIVGIAFTQDSETRVCSGLYISARRILTAAHCTCGASNYRVTNEDFDKGKFRAATFVARFGNYNCDKRYIPRGDDLALLEITQPLWSTDIATTCPQYSLLPAIEFAAHWFPTPPENISVAGYGFSGSAAQDLGSRQEAVVSLDSVLCATRQARGLSCLPFAEFVAGATPVRGTARDTCGGDSGGPAFFSARGNFIPFGVISRALPVNQRFPDKACGSGGVYTHLGRSDVITWLKDSGVPDGEPNCGPAAITE